MEFVIKREDLLKPLQAVSGVVEKKQSMPILSHVMLEVSEEQLRLTGTDTEVELQAKTDAVDTTMPGTTTLPARKIMDICRNLPDEAIISFSLDQAQATVKAGRSRFVLHTLPSEEFPKADDEQFSSTLSVSQQSFRELLEGVAFSMAQQDVRYALNGMLLQYYDQGIRVVATDGHRLALATQALAVEERTEVIVPRKAVSELLRLLDDDEQMIDIQISSRCLRIMTQDAVFTSKLIDARYPDFERVIPRGGDKIIMLDRDVLKQALSRVLVLSNEKYRGTRFMLEPGLLILQANNPEQEEAIEEMEIDYSGDSLEIGFNGSYILDVLANVPSGPIKFTLNDPNSSMLIEAPTLENRVYVVMPMRL